MDRYARQIALREIGSEGQKRLLNSSALIVGLGGLGSPVALYLTGAGVGRIGLCDHDTVSVSNLQRQILYSESDLGKMKTDAAICRLSSLNSDLQLEGWHCRVNEEIISRYDLIIDCCDNFATRYLIDNTCQKLGKPWLHAAIGSFSGQITLFTPGCTTRYSDLYPDMEQLSAQPKAETGVIGAIAGTIGAIVASEAIKLLAGAGTSLDGQMLSIDLKQLKFNLIEL